MTKQKLQEKDDRFVVTVQVKNTGGRDGVEVVQVYAGSQGAVGGEDRPIKLLKGFQRVELGAGEEKEVRIEIPKAELKFWTPNGWVLDEAYTFYVGSNCHAAERIKNNRQRENLPAIQSEDCAK